MGGSGERQLFPRSLQKTNEKDPLCRPLHPKRCINPKRASYKAVLHARPPCIGQRQLVQFRSRCSTAVGHLHSMERQTRPFPRLSRLPRSPNLTRLQKSRDRLDVQRTTSLQAIRPRFRSRVLRGRRSGAVWFVLGASFQDTARARLQHRNGSTARMFLSAFVTWR